MEIIFEVNFWLSLATLTILEIVLGIDNIIFLSITTSRLPAHQQAKARKIGLSLALIMRIVLLTSLVFISRLITPIFSIGSFEVSWRDIILLAGGLFLIAKSTTEIHHFTEDLKNDGEEAKGSIMLISFTSAIIQIIILDLVFSLDSIITAIGISKYLSVMIISIMIAIIIMMLAAEMVSAFIERNPTIKMLALAFLLLVGVALMADGMHFDIPRGYLYFAIFFSIFVEYLNMRARKNSN